MPDAATIPPDQTQYVPGAPIPLENTAASRALAASIPSGGAGQQQPAPPSNNPYDAYVQKQAAAGKEPPLAAGPAAQPSPPSENGGRIAPAQIEEYFVQKGLTPAQAKGMTRAFMEESGGDPDAFNPAGGGQGAAGLAQWRAARQQRLVSQYGPRPTAQQQLDFAWQELNTTEKPAFDAVRTASSETAAYDAFKSKFERPGPPAGEMKAGATLSFQEFMNRNEEMQKTESESLQKVLAEAGKEAPGSQERHQAMQQAMEHSARLAQTFEDIASHPPTATPVDAIQNFGSLASVIGIFGGLLSRRPLTAALGAAGAAMQAKTANNDEQFNRAYKMWHDQTSLVSQALSFQNQEINQIIADERLSESERQDKLSNVFLAWGMQHQLDQAALGNWAEVYKMTQALQTVHAKLDETRAQTDFYKARAAQAAGGGAGGFEASKTVQILDKDGNVVRTTLARERKNEPGWVDSATGDIVKLEKGQQIREISPGAAGAGGRAGAQIVRQQIGAREVQSDLENVVNLPVGTTTGMLGSVVPGTSMTDALKGDLARQLTGNEAGLMQASMAGVSRELSILMSPVYGGHWAASAMDPLIPQEGNSIGLSLFKLARIRQSADNALEALSHSPLVSNEEREYAKTMRESLGKAIFWTPAQALAFTMRGKPSESFGDFVKSHVAKGSDQERPDQVQNGWLYKWKGGKYEPVAPVQ